MNESNNNIVEIDAQKSGLRAVGLSKSFKKRKVVCDVDVSVERGQVVGLLGPNGAGKSTAFYMITGRIQPDAGHVFVDNEEVSNLPMHRRAKLGVGYLPQEASVFRKLSVSENIMAVLEYRKDLNDEAREAELERLLGEFNITHIKDGLGQSLSGGERRRVEIARSLAANPKFILLDEPFAGVDPISVLDIQRIIKQLTASNIGVLITDHNVRETLTICDQAYILNAGQIIAKGTPKDILDDPCVREIYLGHDFKM